MTTPPLTPPADAPLPWRDLSTSETYDDDHDDRYLVDANGDAVVFVDDESTMGVVGYLVAAANAAPRLVAERDAAVEMHTLNLRSMCRMRDERDVVRGELATAMDRLRGTEDRAILAETALDAALARVAAQAEVIAAWRAWNTTGGDTGANEARLDRAEAALAALETP